MRCGLESVVGLQKDGVWKYSNVFVRWITKIVIARRDGAPLPKMAAVFILQSGLATEGHSTLRLVKCPVRREMFLTGSNCQVFGVP